MSNLTKKLALGWPPSQWVDVGVVVAVSGGADSIALLRALTAIRQSGQGKLVVAHYNHRLRGVASDHDETFVRELAASLDLPCEAGQWQHRREPTGRSGEHVDEPPETGTGEAEARQARYEFLRDTAHRIGARYVATAHTADDQAETVLHHVLRGTGLAGLAGMSRTRRLSDAVTLIRPLLNVTRVDAEQYLEQLGQPYCHDASNDDLTYTRNRIRHEVLPQLSASFNPRLDEALRNLAQSAGGACEVIKRIADELVETSCTVDQTGRVVIQIDRLGDESAYLVREMLIAIWRDQNWPRQAMRFEHWARLAEMVGGTDATAAQVFPGNVDARREGGRLVLTRRRDVRGG